MSGVYETALMHRLFNYDHLLAVDRRRPRLAPLVLP